MDAFNALPKVVTTAVETHYPGYSIDDAGWIETKDSGSYYELELEKAGSPDVHLRLAEDGQVINAYN